MERKFSRIVSGIMSVVMFVFSVVNLSGVSAEEEYITDVLDVTAVSATIDGKEISNDTTVYNNAELALEFSWELNVGGYEPPVTFAYDLSDKLKNISIKDNQTILTTNARYNVVGQMLYITLLAGTSGRSGSCELQGNINLDNAQVEDGNRVTVQFIDKIYTPMAPSLVSGLYVSKSAADFTYEGGKYYQSYKVVIGNNSNSDATNVYLKDIYDYSDNGIFADENLHGLTVNGTPKTAVSGQNIEIGTVAKGETVTVTYKTEVSAEKALANKDTKNTAKVEYFNGEDTVSVQGDAWANINKPYISKTGSYVVDENNPADKKIVWTITAGEGILSNGDFTPTFTDKPDGVYYNVSDLLAAIPGSSDNFDGTVTLPINSSHYNNGVYTFTYETDVPDGADDSLFGTHIKNTASVTFDDDNSSESYTYTADGSATVPGKDGQYITKTANGFDKTSGEIEWTVSVDVPNDSTIDSLTIYDYVKNKGAQTIVDGSFVFANGNSYTFAEDAEDHFKLEFNNWGPNFISDVIGENITFTYKTKVDTSVDGYENLVYENKAEMWIFNTEYKQLYQSAIADVTPRFTISKASANPASYSQQGRRLPLGWEIKIAQSDYVFSADEEIVIVDKIPDTLYYVENSLRTSITSGTVVSSASPQNGQEVTFTLKLDADAADTLNNGGTLSVYYDTAMSEENYVDIYMNNNEDVKLTFKNDANVTIDSETVNVSHTQEITVQVYKILSKSDSASVSATIPDTFEATYNITVNSEALDLVPASENITVTDTLGYYLTLQGTPNIYPEASYEYDSDTNTLKFNLKDSTTYYISYSVTGKQLPKNNTLYDDKEIISRLYSNTVTLEGESGENTVRDVCIDSSTFTSKGTYTYKITLKGKKSWNNVVDGIDYSEDVLPEKVILRIKYEKTDIFGVKSEGYLDKTATIAIKNGVWEYTIDGLTVMDTDCNQYVYSVEEIERYRDGYTVQYTVVEKTEDYTIIDIENTFTAPETEVGKVTVNKVWDDDNDSRGKRPESVTITLKNETTGKIYTEKLESGKDSVTFSNLPLYTYSRDAEDNLVGTPCKYSISESAAEGYSSACDVKGVFTLTGARVPGAAVNSTKNITFTNTYDGKTTTTTAKPEESTTTTTTTTATESGTTTTTATPESGTTTTTTTTTTSGSGTATTTSASQSSSTSTSPIISTGSMPIITTAPVTSSAVITTTIPSGGETTTTSAAGGETTTTTAADGETTTTTAAEGETTTTTAKAESTTVSSGEDTTALTTSEGATVTEAVTTEEEPKKTTAETEEVTTKKTTTGEQEIFEDSFDDSGSSDGEEEENPYTSVSLNLELFAALAFGAYAVYPRKKKNK